MTVTGHYFFREIVSYWSNKATIREFSALNQKAQPNKLTILHTIFLFIEFLQFFY